MKRILSIVFAALFAAAMLTSLVSCGASGGEDIKPVATLPSATKQPIGADSAKTDSKRNSSVTVTSAECVAAGGWYIILANDRGIINVTPKGDAKAAGWKVYLSDDKVGDPASAFASAEPVLEGEGSFRAEKGQYVYVFCAAESEGASLKFVGNALTH